MRFFSRILARDSGVQSKFLVNVIIPPLLTLIVLGLVGYLALSATVRASAETQLGSVSDTIAGKIDREFTLRKQVLKNLAQEYTQMESSYKTLVAANETDSKGCADLIKQKNDYVATDGGPCVNYLPGLVAASRSGGNLLEALSVAANTRLEELRKAQNDQINTRLSSYINTFPETTNIIISDDKGMVGYTISAKGVDTSKFQDYFLRTSKKTLGDHGQQITGDVITSDSLRRVVFAYPIKQSQDSDKSAGVIYAGFNLDSKDYLYPSWKTTKVDSSKEYYVIVNKNTLDSFPRVSGELYKPALDEFSTTKNDVVEFKGVGSNYVGTFTSVENTPWVVLAASPVAYALDTVAQTRIVGITVIGVLILGFLWVGTMFTRRTVREILPLVAAAVSYTNGNLDYKIETEKLKYREFKQLGEILNNMADRTKQAEAEIEAKNKELINIVTHEIRSPLTAINGSLSMLVEEKMGQMDDTANTLATRAFLSTNRLNNLITDLLDMARLDAGKTVFNVKSVDMNKVVANMIEMQQESAIEHRVKLYKPSKQVDAIVDVDPTKIEVVLTNLLSNAIKYNNPDGGSVSVELNSDDTMLTVAVSDTGLGIPDEQKSGIFQKFFTIKDDQRFGIPSSGLGLYVTKGFVEGMGGKIWFESNLASGTVFYFTVPLTSAKIEQPATGSV